MTKWRVIRATEGSDFQRHLLDTGWEPFAVTVTLSSHGQATIWFRREAAE